MQDADGRHLFDSMKSVNVRTASCRERESNLCILLVEAVAFACRQRFATSWRQALGCACHLVDLPGFADTADVCPGCARAPCGRGRGPLPPLRGDALGRSGGCGRAANGLRERNGPGSCAGCAYGGPALALLAVQ